MYIAKAINSKAYFSHPYSSRKTGLNENNNGLITSAFKKVWLLIDHKKCKAVMVKINNRPKKYLGYKTPSQEFLGINLPV